MTEVERRAALDAIAAEVRDCTRCRLHETRTKAVPGEGDPSTEVVFVGEGPGFNEDREGRPFIGRAGDLLVKLLASLGWRRSDVFITNVVKCRPPDNRDPRPEEITACRPYLEQQLDLIAPKVLVTLGKFAGQLLLDSTVGITKLRGHDYPYRGAVLIPTLHPAYALRGGGEPLAQMRADFVRAKRALVAAGSPTIDPTVEIPSERNA